MPETRHVGRFAMGSYLGPKFLWLAGQSVYHQSYVLRILARFSVFLHVNCHNAVLICADQKTSKLTS